MLRTLLTSPAVGTTALRNANGGTIVGSKPLSFVTRVATSIRNSVAIAATGLAMFAGLGVDSMRAQAPVGLREVGPTDPSQGFPQYYGDANGLRLRLCQDPNVCFFALPNPAAPLRFPTSPTDPLANYPDEQFYWGIPEEQADRWRQARGEVSR